MLNFLFLPTMEGGRTDLMLSVTPSVFRAKSKSHTDCTALHGPNSFSVSVNVDCLGPPLKREPIQRESVRVTLLGMATKCHIKQMAYTLSL